MNVKLASALAFAGGVGVGALAMWRAAGSHFRQKADDEIEEMRVYYEDRANESLEEAKRAVETALDEAMEDEWRDRPENQIVIGPNGPSYADDPELKRNLDWEASEGYDLTPEAVTALQEYKGEPDTPVEPQFAILLTQREFEEGPPDDYDQTTLTYYILDGILTAQNDKQIEVSKAVGAMDPAWFGEGTDYPDVCYVRNTRMKIDFEIVRSLESYSKTVLGLGEESG